MALHRLTRDEQRLGDLPIGLTRGEGPQHIELPFGQFLDQLQCLAVGSCRFPGHVTHGIRVINAAFAGAFQRFEEISAVAADGGDEHHTISARLQRFIHHQGVLPAQK